MYNSITYRSVILPKLLLYTRACYSSRPVKDLGAVHRAKPEEIPKDIWAEDKDSKYISVEEVKGHWHYVERLFPKLRIPEPPKNVSSVGWKAPDEKIPDLPYFIQRTRNHMLPVYEDRLYKDRVLVTRVAKVHGDIWELEYELKNYLEETLGEKVESNVSEIMCCVYFRGTHVEIIKEWLFNKGF